MKRAQSIILLLATMGLLTACGNDLEDSSVADGDTPILAVIADETSTVTSTTASETTTTTTITSTSVTTSTTTTTEEITTTPTTTSTTATETVLLTVEQSIPVETGAVLESETQPTTEAIIESEYEVPAGNICPVTGVELQYSARYYVCDSPLTASMGVAYFGGHTEKYYSERVLPGNGLSIPDRHYGEDGTIRDADGYIVVAADYGYLSYGSILLTTLGPAKVYDTGCPWGIIDIYVNW